MELAITIAAIIGILLFVIAYLRFVISGFKHHPVTGLIAMFPVLNIIVVPSLWYKNGRFLIVGFLGLLLAVGAWTMGAEKGAYKYLNLLMGKNQQRQVSEIQAVPAITSTPLSIPNSQAITQVTPSIKTNVIVDESNFESLPTKALYKMGFDTVPVNDIANLKGRVVRVMDKNLTLFEGRIINVSASSVNLQITGGLVNMELPVSNIKKLSLMVKKPL